MDRPGHKLLLTGNGRCNISNAEPLTGFLKYYRPDGRFLRQAFAIFFTPQLVEFFERLGIRTVTEAKGRILPAAAGAKEVVDAMVRLALRNGVIIRTAAAVKELLVDKTHITGVKCAAGEFIEADAVIIATGGASYPSTGSSGDGYRLAESAGHTIIPIRPALVPLETAGNTAQKLQGLSLDDVTVQVWIDGRKKTQLRGEVLFTHFGLSGPAVISISSAAVDALAGWGKVSVSMDLLPDIDHQKLDKKLVDELSAKGRQKIVTVISSFAPRRLAEVFMELADVPADTVCSQITADHRKKLRMLLKDFRFEITAHRPIAEAIVTAGGVDTREIDPRTMRSRIIEGLYFAGEVIDIDGDTGGYNLQAAFSTGFLAGRSAAKESR